MGLNVFIYDKIVRTGDIIVVPSNNYQVGYEVTKIKNIWVDYVFRSAAGTKNATLEVESEGSVAITSTCCALYGLNLTSSYTTLKLQRYSAGWIDVANFTYDDTNGRALAFYTEVSSTKYRIVMDDATLSSYVQLGVIVLGHFKQPSRTYEYGASSDLDDASRHTFSKDGHLNVVEGRTIELQTVVYEVLAVDEAKLEAVYSVVRKKYPLVFVEDYADATGTMKYIIFQGKFGRTFPGNLFKTIRLSWIRLD